MSNTQRSRLSSARSQRGGSAASRAGSASAYSRAGSARSIRSDAPETQPTPLLRPVTANNPRTERAFYSDILGPATQDDLEELTQGPEINVASRQAVRTGSKSVSVNTMLLPEDPQRAAAAGGFHTSGPRPPPKSVRVPRSPARSHPPRPVSPCILSNSFAPSRSSYTPGLLLVTRASHDNSNCRKRHTTQKCSVPFLCRKAPFLVGCRSTGNAVVLVQTTSLTCLQIAVSARRIWSQVEVLDGMLPMDLHQRTWLLKISMTPSLTAERQRSGWNLAMKTAR